MPPWRDQTYCPRRTSSLQSSTGEAPGKEICSRHPKHLFLIWSLQLFNLMWGLNLSWDAEKWLVARSKHDWFCSSAGICSWLSTIPNHAIYLAITPKHASGQLCHSTVLSLLTLLAGSISGFTEDVEWDVTMLEELGQPVFLDSTFTETKFCFLHPQCDQGSGTQGQSPMVCMDLLPWICLWGTPNRNGCQRGQDGIWKKERIHWHLSLPVFLWAINELCVVLHTPLKLQAHFVGQGMQQQHSLPPGSIDLIPFHRNAGETAKPEVIYCAKLPAVPVIRRIINKCARLGKALGLITK